MTKKDMAEKIAERIAMREKIRGYVTESIQRLEVFTDIEICTKRDLDTAHEKAEIRLTKMSDTELENMCNRIDFENDYETYYEILG